MASPEEIAWAAGLFEGEGSISRYRRQGQSFDIRVGMNMTDEDVIRQFDAVVDRGKVYGPYSPRLRGSHPKPIWNWVALGDAGHDVIDLLGPWFLSRRAAQARAHGVLIEDSMWVRCRIE